MELLTSISYILMYKTLGLTWSFAAYSVLLGILIITTFIDIEQQIIPNILIVIGLVTGLFLVPSVSQLVLRMLFWFLSWLRSLLIVALLAKLLIRKEGMGGGDIKLLGMIGLF